MKLQKNQALSLVGAFNGIARSEGQDAKSHLVGNYSWYFSQDSIEFGDNHEVRFGIDPSFVAELAELSEEECEELLRKIHEFWGNDEYGLPSYLDTTYHIPDTDKRLREVGLIGGEA